MDPASTDEKGTKRTLDEADGNSEGEENLDSSKESKKVRKDEGGIQEDAEDSDDDSDSQSEEEMNLGESPSSESEGEEEDVLVDFEGVPPVEEDLGAIDALVSQVYRGLSLSTNNLARMLVTNDRLTTILKDQDPEETNTYGVASVVNLSQPSNATTSEFATEFRNLVKQGYMRMNNITDMDKLPEVLQNFEISTDKSPKEVFGLVVVEKIINIPTLAVWTLLNALNEDILEEDIKFTYFFVLTKFYRVEDEVVPYEGYYETISNASTFFIDFSLPKDTDTIPHNGKVGVPFRRLFVLPSNSFYEMVSCMNR